MSLNCCVRGCINGTEQTLDPTAKFFSFPTVRDHQGPRVEELTRRRRMAWVSAVRRPSITFDSVNSMTYVCSRHFHKGQPAYEASETDQDWAPSLHLGHPPPPDAPPGTRRSPLQTSVSKPRRSPCAPFFVQSECCVVKCGGRSHNDRGQRIRNGLTFHPFPLWRGRDGVFISELTKRRRTAWVDAVGRVDITFDNVPDDARVCSRHFISGKPVHDMMENDPDWVPSLLMSNGNPPFVRKRKKIKKKKNKEAKKKRPKVLKVVGNTEKPKPSAPSWTEVKSHLQDLMKEDEPPPEPAPVLKPAPVLEESVQDFKDFFQNALKASLDACRDSSSQTPAEPRPSLDPGWFSVPEKRPRFSVPVEPCQNCVHLQERISELEERLAAPQFIRSHSDFSTWAPSFSEPPQAPDPERLSPSPQKKAMPSFVAKFPMEWLSKYWFLRYCPKQNVMWCYVCRLNAGPSHAHSSFVKGTQTFHIFAIEQHSRTSYHVECTNKFRESKGVCQLSRSVTAHVRLPTT